MFVRGCCYFIALLSLSSLGLLAQGQQATTPPPAIVAANNTFGFQLYSKLAKAEATRNVFISPVSIEYCLAMVANGAQGKTYTQMAQTLGWGDMPLAQVDAGFQTLTKRLLKSDAQVQLALANSLWLDSGSTFRDSFIATNKQYFDAELRTVSFTDPATVPTINDWVKGKTQGMIPSLLSKNDVDRSTLMVLLNALYFKGQWTTPFDAQLTSEQPFSLMDGTKQAVKMMQRSSKFSYYEDAHLQMVRLPYGDGRLSMFVILPSEGETLDNVAQLVFTGKDWLRYAGQLQLRQGTLDLPRFAARYSVDLPAALKSLGISDAFSKNANFSGISVTPSYISQVRHKTVLEVNEEGTKAAAVTGVMMARMSVAPRPSIPPFVMRVNRPFLFALQNEDGALLFLGQITKPE